MKRKWADRADWARVTGQRSRLLRLTGSGKENPPGIVPAAGVLGFSGFLVMLQIDRMQEPLVKQVNGNALTLADSGYTWLQHLPERGYHCLTTAFDREGNIVEWYFDVVKEVGQEPGGRVYFDDLYLDVIATPGSEPEILDEDELEQALDERLVSPADFDLAWAEIGRILRGPLADQQKLMAFCTESLNLVRRAD